MNAKKIKNKYLFGFIFTIALLAYANTINHSYTWDDALVITNNKYTKKGFSGLNDIWSKKVFLHNRSVYRPVPQSFYAITYQVFGYNPKPAHVLNIVFYAILSVVTFWFLTIFFTKQNRWLLYFISLLFVLHPLHTEVVANVKSLDEILAYLFSILSLIFWIKSFNNFFRNIVFVIVFMCLAMLSKISSITILPVFIIIYFYNIKKPYGLFTDFKYRLLHIKTYLLSKNYSNKILYFGLLFLSFLSIVAVVYNAIFLSFLVLLFYIILLYKTNNNLFIWMISISAIILMTLFSYYLLLILFSVFIIIFFAKKINTYFNFYSISILFLFSLSYFFFKQEYPTLIFLIVLAFFSYFYTTNKQIISIVPLSIILIISVYISNKIFSTITISMILLISYTLFSNSKREKYIYTVLIVISVLFTITIEKNPSISRKIYNTLNPTINKIKPKNNVDITKEMTPVNNSLFNETNQEIKFATIAVIQLKYIQLLLYPHPLLHQYGFNQIEKSNYKDWKVWFSVIVHLLLFLFALYRLKDKSPISFGILFYLSTISIYTNIVILMPDTLAERFLFTPSLGFAIAFVFTLHYFIQKLNFEKKPFILFMLLLPIYLAFTYKTFDRNKAWKNNLTLSEKTIKYAPNNAAINAQYATELMLLNKSATKVEHYYKRALEIYPDFYSVNKDLSTLYITKKEPNKALPYLQKCYDIYPNNWETNYFLAFINYDNKEYTKATTFFENSLLFGKKYMDTEKKIYTSEYLARCYFNNNLIDKSAHILQGNYQEFQAKSSIILLANIYHQSGDVKKAYETYLFLQKDFPNDQNLIKTIEILKNKLNE